MCDNQINEENKSVKSRNLKDIKANAVHRERTTFTDEIAKIPENKLQTSEIICRKFINFENYISDKKVLEQVLDELESSKNEPAEKSNSDQKPIIELMNKIMNNIITNLFSIEKNNRFIDECIFHNLYGFVKKCHYIIYCMNNDWEQGKISWDDYRNYIYDIESFKFGINEYLHFSQGLNPTMISLQEEFNKLFEYNMKLINLNEENEKEYKMFNTDIDTIH